MEKQNSLGARSQRSVNRAAAVFLLPVTILLIVYIFYPIVDSFQDQWIQMERYQCGPYLCRTSQLGKAS